MENREKPYYRMTVWMTQEECMESSWFDFLFKREYIPFCVAQGFNDERYAIWCWGKEYHERKDIIQDEIGKITFARKWPVPIDIHNEEVIRRAK